MAPLLIEVPHRMARPRGRHPKRQMYVRELNLATRTTLAYFLSSERSRWTTVTHARQPPVTDAFTTLQRCHVHVRLAVD